jgi:16S rRNA (cytosine1402-N4)-methyltransferase
MASPRDHIPVLYEQVLTGLRVKPGGRYVDATLGTAGHATGILQASTPGGRLLGLDADPDAVRFSHQVLRPFGDRAVLQPASFRELEATAAALGFVAVDGILFDLGFSSRQLVDAERGFSFSKDGPLDMRFDRSRGQTASELINQLSQEELAELLWHFGEERYSRRIARAIVAARPVTSTSQLASLIADTVGRRERIHPATRTFQALRIAVNEELQALSEALPQACDLLAPGGRLAVISFHSLEDRIVKRFYQHEARDCICPPEAPSCVCQHRAALQIVTRKPIRPDQGEIKSNPRSRSAKLRIAERLVPEHRETRAPATPAEARRK